MSLVYLFDMPDGVEWVLIASAILVILATMVGIAFLIYFLVKKATKDTYKELTKNNRDA